MITFNLESDTYGPVIFKSLIPASLAKCIIPGSEVFSAEGLYGNILLQQINAGKATLFYTVCKIRKDLALDFSISGPGCLVHISLKNENRFDIGTNTFYMKEGQFNIIRSSSVSGTFYMEQGNEYRIFSICCPREQLQQLLPFFPFLHFFIHKAHSGKPLLLFKNHHWMNSQLIDIVSHLLNCTYRGDLRQLYFEYKTKELLFLLLNQEYAEINTRKSLNDHTVELINEAKYMIEAGFGEPITLHKIAKRLGISEKKLQTGLKQLFGMVI